MRKQPDDRPASAQAVVEQLRAIEEKRRPKPWRRWLLGTAAAVLLAAALTAWGAWSSLSAPADPVEVAFDYDEPDARLALRLGDDAERILDVKKERVVSLAPGDYALRAVAPSGKRVLRPERVLVKPGEKKTVAVQLIGEIDGRVLHQPHPVRGLAVVPRPGGLLVVSAGEDRCLFAWQPGTKDRPAQALFPDGPFSCAALAADGKTLATGCSDVTRKSGNVVRFWNAETLAQVPGGFACDSQINALAYCGDGPWLLVGLNNGLLSLCDVRTGLLESQREAHDGGVYAVAFLPGGKRLLSTGRDGSLAEWALEKNGDARELNPVRTMPGHTGVVRGLAVLPGGKQAVSAGTDKTIRVWDLDSGKVTATLTAPEPIHALAVAPDGSRLLTGDAAGKVRLWDVSRCEHVETFPGHAKSVTALAFAPDGRRAVSGDAGGAVLVWQLPK
jgi:WD40 repeat protein